MGRGTCFVFCVVSICSSGFGAPGVPPAPDQAQSVGTNSSPPPLPDVTSRGAGKCVEDVYLDPCGNGFRLGTEQCDDGNTLNGDGCSSNCTFELGWECSGGSGSSADTCKVLSPLPASISNGIPARHAHGWLPDLAARLCCTPRS